MIVIYEEDMMTGLSPFAQLVVGSNSGIESVYWLLREYSPLRVRYMMTIILLVLYIMHLFVFTSIFVDFHFTVNISLTRE